MFVVNFHALAQASDFRIEKSQAVFLCWMQDSNPGFLEPNLQQTEYPLANRMSYQNIWYVLYGSYFLLLAVVSHFNILRLRQNGCDFLVAIQLYSDGYPTGCMYLSEPSVVYSISQEICTRFCCALLCCGYAIVHNEFTWSIYPYLSGLLCWHWGDLTIAPVPVK